VPAQTYWRAQATVAYEADLFGRVRNSVSAADADAERVEALYRAARLSLQADVAQTYFSLRTLDAEEALLARTVVGREEALKLVQRRFNTGDIGELDVARADAELATARSDRIGVQRRRAVLEHALATLLGKAPSNFTMNADPLQAASVRVPSGLPSALLERRLALPAVPGRRVAPPASAWHARRSSRSCSSPAASASNRMTLAICSSGAAARGCSGRWSAPRYRCRSSMAARAARA
jgi:multidrug efflux system outer membrane protein